MTERVAFLTAAAGIPLAACASALLPPLAEAVFGPGFAPTAGVLGVLLWATAVAMTGNVFAQALIVQGRQRQLLLVRAVGLVAGLGLTVALLPRLGVVGAPAASLVAEVVVLALLVRALPPAPARRPEIARRAAGLATASLGLVAALRLLRDVPAAAAGAGVAAYAALVLATGALTARDRDLLRQAARALARPAAGRREAR
jgi:O-antigen/teichoic acid export membrane protein